VAFVSRKTFFTILIISWVIKQASMQMFYSTADIGTNIVHINDVVVLVWTTFETNKHFYFTKLSGKDAESDIRKLSYVALTRIV
jgi:hypothetical protein